MKTKNAVKMLALPALTMAMSVAQAAQGDWLVRGRIVDVVPYASSNNLGTVNGKVSEVSTNVIPELDISYFLTQNIAAELILGTSKHNVKAQNTSVGTVDLGDVHLLPPTLTLQWHFMPESRISPYIGAGLNYTYFYDVSRGSAVNAITYASSFGPALQAGVDVMIDKHWSINADIKKVYIQSNVDVDIGATHLSPTVRLNPIIMGLGVGYRFNFC